MSFAFAAMIAACAPVPSGYGAPASAPDQPAARAGCLPAGGHWRQAATEDDRRRLRQAREAWTRALDQARADHAPEIAREGPLLDMDAALPAPMPPVGEYDCRTLKIGTPSTDGLNWVAYPAFRCQVREQGGHMIVNKLTGSQRPIGRLYPDSERRLIFLGTLQFGDERQSHEYGVDRDRDLVASVERVGERRWRMAFPYPHFESLLDVIELTPRIPVP